MKIKVEMQATDAQTAWARCCAYIEESSPVTHSTGFGHNYAEAIGNLVAQNGAAFGITEWEYPHMDEIRKAARGLNHNEITFTK